MIKQAKKLVASFVVGVGMLVGTPAHAGIPVIDATSIAQQIQQVIAWGKQYGQMVQQIQQYATQIQQFQTQIQQLQQHIQAVTGARNLGDIANSQLLHSVAPDIGQLATTYNDIRNLGTNGLTGAAQAIRSASMVYNCENLTGDEQKNCQALFNNTSQAIAYGQNALDLATQRNQQIQQLMQAINQTNDPKSIAEIQARIQAETTMVSNDANRLATLRSLGEAQDRAARQALKEQEMKVLRSQNRAIDTFAYQAP